METREFEGLIKALKQLNRRQCPRLCEELGHLAEQNRASITIQSLVTPCSACPHCGGTLKIITTILESSVITKILCQLGLLTQAPLRSPVLVHDSFEPIKY